MATDVSKKKNADSDLKVVSRDDEAATFTAKIFGEEFLFSSDTNGWLVFMASTGKAEHMEKLMHSMILIPDAEDKSESELRLARFREAERFSEVLGSQQNFSLERMFRLVNDIIEAAGNDHTDS